MFHLTCSDCHPKGFSVPVGRMMSPTTSPNNGERTRNKLNKALSNLPAPAGCTCAVLLVLLCSTSLKSQTLIPGQPPSAASEGNSTASTTIRVPEQNFTASPFLGSIPAGQKTTAVLPLSMEEALSRA